ncbi:MAG: PaaI family thioesterase [Proteobacteria bacterium]|nr:PaaI family thioesterase [Pseudomonadota bacterium]
MQKRLTPARPAASKAELQRLLDSERFLRPWKFRVVKVANGECTVAMPNSPSLERPGGMVNGPALIAAADVAMWLAIKSTLGMQHDALTSDLNTLHGAYPQGRQEALLRHGRLQRRQGPDLHPPHADVHPRHALTRSGAHKGLNTWD